MTTALMEEHIQEMQRTITAMKQQIEELKAENKSLKEQQTYNHVHNKDDVGTLGRSDQGKWREGGQRYVDPWAGWKGRDNAWKSDDEWVDDDGKWKNKVEREVNDERATRVWWGGRIDRRNEMVARGFKRNTYWKEIKSKVEGVLGESKVTNGGVKVIGQMASFAIIRFEEYENKQQFKLWLQTSGAERIKEQGIWFGENIDKDARARERAVGKVKRALFLRNERRTDVYRDYRRGIVYVGDVVVARWDETLKVMMFRGEGKEIRESYKRLLEEGKREEDGFSE